MLYNSKYSLAWRATATAGVGGGGGGYATVLYFFHSLESFAFTNDCVRIDKKAVTTVTVHQIQTYRWEYKNMKFDDIIFLNFFSLF